LGTGGSGAETHGGAGGNVRLGYQGLPSLKNV
jgi:hypothetical protein